MKAPSPIPKNPMQLTGARRIAWWLRHATLAPPTPPIPVDGPLVVAGFFTTASGVGTSARACVSGLQNVGVDPICIDLSAAFGQADMSSAAVSTLVRPPPLPSTPSGTLILHANAPETERALFELGAFRPRKWRLIGYWAWEQSRAPASWARPSRRLSEIWTPSTFVASALDGVAEAPVKVVPHFVDADGINPSDAEIAEMRARLGLSDETTMCLAMADGRSSFVRKNLIGAVEIFKHAVDDRTKAVLVLKTRNLTEFPSYRAELSDAVGSRDDIKIFDEALSEANRNALLGATDILLSPHRAEGFGLVLAEAMALGKPVLATKYSGNLSFMDDASAMLVESPITPAIDASGVYGEAYGSWADPDIAAFSAALRDLLGYRRLRAELGDAGRRRVRKTLNGRGYLDALEKSENACAASN